MKTRQLFILGRILIAMAASVPALFAQQMNYQGRLTDASGNPLVDGQYTLTFDLYDAPDSGTKIWGPFIYDGATGDGHSAKADLVNGRFNVILGPNDTASRPISDAFGSARFLQITVAADPPLMPRQQILAAPEALHAVNANHAKTADGISGNLSVTGDFTVGETSTFTGKITAPAGFTGNVNFDSDVTVANTLHIPAIADFSATSRQMINLNGAASGIGVQDNNTEYFRSGSFAWYSGGSHVSNPNDPGVGGKLLMTLDSRGLVVSGNSSGDGTYTAVFANANKGPNVSVVHWGQTGDRYIRSAADNGNVVLQDTGGSTRVGGFLGIGGAPDFPLHVSSKKNANFMQSVGDLQNYSGGLYQHQSDAADYSIVSDGFVWAPAFQATSDRRIKSIDGDSDIAHDLETVQKLKVTDYHYIDKAANGGSAQKGFIAQEVRRVIPEAVMSGAGYIPSIFVDATKVDFDAARKSVTVSVSKPHGLQIGDKVRLLTEKAGTLELTVASVASDQKFTIDACEKEPGRIFVYGKHIDDLLNLNYDRIFSTGIGAIQELARRVDRLEENQRHLADIQRKADRVDDLEEQVKRLTELLSRAAAGDSFRAENLGIQRQKRSEYIAKSQ